MNGYFGKFTLFKNCFKYSFFKSTLITAIFITKPSRKKNERYLYQTHTHTAALGPCSFPQRVLHGPDISSSIEGLGCKLDLLSTGGHSGGPYSESDSAHITSMTSQLLHCPFLKIQNHVDDASFCYGPQN